MFFKRNLYGDMLRSRRLGQIAERYRKPFLNERMDRISYERNYKKYMLDVMYAMRRELSQFPMPILFIRFTETRWNTRLLCAGPCMTISQKL